MAATKNINILLKLQDKFTKPLQGTTKEIRAQKAQINAATKSIRSFGNKANSVFLGSVKGATKMAAAFTGLGGILSVASLKGFISDTQELAKAQVEAETKLEAVLGNVKSIAAGGQTAIQNAKAVLMGTASAIQQVGVIGDEVTLAGMQQLATFQLGTKEINALSKGMTDLLAQQKGLNATQSDAVSIANMIGKAMSGQVSALSRVGITFTDAQKAAMEVGNAEQRAAVLAEILQQNVGGVNEALAKTDQGAIQQVSNAWGDAKEEIGKHVLSIKGLLARNFADYIPKIQEKVTGVLDNISGKLAEMEQNGTIAAIGEKIAQAAETAWKGLEIVGKAIKWAYDHANILIPVLTGVAAGFTAFNVLSTVGPIVKNFSKTLEGVKTAGGLVNAVFRASPFGAVAIAIGLAVTAGVLLYKNWDKVKAAAQALNDKVMDVFGKIHDKIVGAFDSIKEKVKPVIDWIQTKVDKLKSAFDTVKGVFSSIGFGANSGTRYSIGQKATGTPYFKGGMTRINEGGRGEIVNLPNGTQIIPHDVSKKSVGGSSVVVNLTVQGNLIGNRAFMEQTGDYIVRKIIAAQGVV